MDFQLTEEQAMLKRNARDFLRKEVIPAVDAYEQNRIVVPHDDVLKFLKKLTPLGYISGLIPEKFGGLELSSVSYGLLMEELSYAWGSLVSIVNIQGTLPITLITRVSEELREKYLPRTLASEIVGCSAISEPEVGSDAPGNIQVKAALDGDEWVINGNKIWTSNGCIADLCIVYAKTEQGISGFLIDRRDSPFETREIHKLGTRCASLAEVTFNNCRIPKSNILGAEGSGTQIVAITFEWARALLGIRPCGLAQAAIDASISYAQERKQFGKPIGKFQMIQEMLCDMVIETECARFLALNALDRLDRGLPCRKESSMSKAYGCEMGVRVTSKAIQIHGAIGLTEDLPLERYFRDARTLTIPDGTTQIQKLIAGREILGMSAIK